eukprot:scaffold2744_cov136-Cylindrotheca_fusiformis.AAC.27
MSFLCLPECEWMENRKHSPFRAGTILIANGALSAPLYYDKLFCCSTDWKTFYPWKGRRPSNGARQFMLLS